MSRAEVMRKNWQSTKFREAQRLAASRAMSKIWNDPVLRKRQSEAISRSKSIEDGILRNFANLIKNRPDLKERFEKALEL